MAYLIIANSDQSKYTNLGNELTNQYSMRNNKYPKELISTIDIMKNHQHNISETRKTDHKISKYQNFKKQNKSGGKEL